jgi:hypothetical protein
MAANIAILIILVISQAKDVNFVIHNTLNFAILIYQNLINIYGEIQTQ